MADNLNVRRGKTFFSSDDEGDDKPSKARKYVYDYILSQSNESDWLGYPEITLEDDIYVVKFTYILGSWKALVSTTVPDGRIYEVTYNHAKGETYVDEYKKVNNVCIPDEEVQ